MQKNYRVSRVKLGARSPGQNIGVFKYYTPEKIFMGSIQNKTLNDISKFPYVLRNFILNTPHKIFLEYGIPKLRNSDQVKHTLQSEKESKMILAHDKEKVFCNTASTVHLKCN